MAVLVLDSSVLSAFARASRLADFERLTAGHTRVTKGVSIHPLLAEVAQQPWLATVAADSPAAGKDRGVHVRRTLAVISQGIHRDLLDRSGRRAR